MFGAGLATGGLQLLKLLSVSTANCFCKTVLALSQITMLPHLSMRVSYQRRVTP